METAPRRGLSPRRIVGHDAAESVSEAVHGPQVSGTSGGVENLCGRQFVFVDGNNPGQTEEFVIHEALHPLGPGENPPSPKKITARILAMCHP